MAIRLIEAFDACTDVSKYLGKWTTISSSATLSATGGRFNSGHMALGISHSFSRTFEAQSTWIVGFARLYTNTVATDFLIFEDSGNEQIVLRQDSNGAICIDRASTQLAISSGALSRDTWFYIEAKVVIANSGGSVIVRVNGADFVSVTNADTQATTNASANAIRFYNTGSSNTGRFDDIYILDSTGSPNDFLGDHRVRTLAPAADDVVQFARSTGAYNYANVDDASPDDDATYNESDVVGARDLLAFNDLPANPGAIRCVQFSARARKDDAGARSLRTVVKSGAAEAVGASAVLGTSYQYIADVFATDPATGAAWTDTAVNAASFGVEVSS